MSIWIILWQDFNSRIGECMLPWTKIVSIEANQRLHHKNSKYPPDMFTIKTLASCFIKIDSLFTTRIQSNSTKNATRRNLPPPPHYWHCHLLHLENWVVPPLYSILGQKEKWTNPYMRIKFEKKNRQTNKWRENSFLSLSLSPPLFSACILVFKTSNGYNADAENIPPTHAETTSLATDWDMVC